MSLTDKDIDNLFKDKAESSSFKYDDSYWKEMEALLPQNSGKDFLWIATSILFFGLVAFSFTRTNGITSKNNTIQIAKETQELSSKEIKNNNTQLVTSIDETSSTENSNVPTITKNSSTNQNYSPIKNNVESKNINSTQKNFTNISTKNSLVEQSQSSTENVLQSSEDINPLQRKGTPLTITQNISDDQTEELENLNTEKGNVSNQTNETVSNLTLKKASLLPNKELGIAPMYLTANMPLRNQFYAQALAGVSQSMITPSDQASYSFGAGIGLQMNKGHFVFNTGLNGVWSHHDDLILTRQAKIYGFGSEVHNYEIKYKEIFSLEADLSVGYQFSNHIVRVGVRPSYIIGTKVGFRELENGDGNIENFYGYNKGVALWGVKPMIGYTYLMNQNLSIGFNIGMQLMPLIDEKYINGQNNSLPFDGQIYIRRTLHFRK